ncbi:MAG: 50S ribosomal protein L15 [Candidatus Altiarchaeota archaeon]|nr:50S ribosomal protein L15 [Candidatus Altiarchaeota archaeon]
MTIRGRGTRTHGHGKTWRGKGKRGGKGWAGVEDHRKVSAIKGGKLLTGGSRKGKIGHMGKYGFNRGGLKSSANSINVSQLERLTDKTEIDLTELGFDKLLGSGKLGKKMKIKVRAWSKRAEEKVNAVGGKLIAPATKKVSAVGGEIVAPANK